MFYCQKALYVDWSEKFSMRDSIFLLQRYKKIIMKISSEINVKNMNLCSLYYAVICLSMHTQCERHNSG